MTPTIASLVIVTLLCLAAWRDLLTRTIPDKISLAIVVIGIAERVSLGWPSLATSVLVSLGIFLVLLPFNSWGVVGGADLKLLSALAIGLSPLASYRLIAMVAMAGAVLALTYLLLRQIVRRPAAARPGGRASRTVRRVFNIELWRVRKGAQLPYGIAIAAGAALVLLAQPGV